MTVAIKCTNFYISCSTISQYLHAKEQVHVASTLALELIDLITSDCKGGIKGEDSSPKCLYSHVANKVKYN